MRKSFAVVLAFVTATLALPAGVFAAAPQAKTGGLRGVARDARQQNLPQVNVQVRAADGSLAGTGTTNAVGQFSFAGLNPGAYTIEILDAAGNIVGTSTVTVTAGAVATVTVTAAAAGAIAAAGAGGVSLFGLGTVGTVAVIGGAAAATIATVVATKGDASPSR